MTLLSDVRAVFRSVATYLGGSLEYRAKVSGSWGAWTTWAAGEIKTFQIMEDMDAKGMLIKRQRAAAKLYDTSAAASPTLRLGDELRKDSLVWTVSEIQSGESGNGIARYLVQRDVPLRAQPDRGSVPMAEGDA